MATVPMATPQVSIQAPQTSPQAFGVNVAQANEQIGERIAQAGSVAWKAQIQEQEKQNNAKVLDLSMQAHNDITAMFNDPNNGLFAKQGNEAQGSHGKAVKFFDDLDKKYAAMTDNSVQAETLKRFMAGQRSAFIQAAGRHEMFEVDKAAEANVAALPGNYGAMTAKNYTDDGILNTSKNDYAKAAYARYAPKYGDEVAKQKISQGISEIVLAAYSGAINAKDYGRAQTILDNNKQYLTDKVYLDMSADITAKKDAIDMINTADQIANAYLRNDGSVDMEQSFKALHAAYPDPIQYSKAEGVLKERINEKIVIKKDHEDQITIDFVKNLQKNSSALITSGTGKAFVDQYCDAAGVTNPELKEVFYRMAERDVNVNKKDVEPAVTYAVIKGIEDGTIKNEADVFRACAGKVDMDVAVRLATSFNTIARKDTTVAKAYINSPEVQSVLKEIKAHDIFYGDHPEHVSNLIAGVERDVLALIKDGKTPTPDEVGQIAREKTAKIIIQQNKLFPNPSTRLSEAASEGLGVDNKGVYYTAKSGRKIYATAYDKGIWYTEINGETLEMDSKFKKQADSM